MSSKNKRFFKTVWQLGICLFTTIEMEISCFAIAGLHNFPMPGFHIHNGIAFITKKKKKQIKNGSEFRRTVCKNETNQALTLLICHFLSPLFMRQLTENNLDPVHVLWCWVEKRLSCCGHDKSSCWQVPQWQCTDPHCCCSCCLRFVALLRAFLDYSLMAQWKSHYSL